VTEQYGNSKRGALLVASAVHDGSTGAHPLIPARFHNMPGCNTRAARHTSQTRQNKPEASGVASFGVRERGAESLLYAAKEGRAQVN
jgi:hypothetical protein